MQITVGNTITISNPNEAIKEWCKKNLVIANPEYTKKLRMNFWLGNTPETIYLYEIHGLDYVLPFGCLRSILPLCGDCQINTTFREPKKIDYCASVPLFDYQEKAVKAIIPEYYGILQSPAGSGKTQMGIALITRLNVRTLWLTHTKDLLTQSMRRAEQYIDKSFMGTITEGKVNIGTGITFATIQTMCELDLRQYRDFWDLIIVDECHRVAGSPTATTQFYEVLNSLSARSKYGLSATVHRADGMIKATYALLGEIVYSVPEEEVADKIIKVGILPIGTETHLTDYCLNTDGTLNYARLISHLCEDQARNREIVDYIIENKDKSCLILSDRLNHLETLMSLLPLDMRFNAVMIDGKMTSKTGKAKREQAIDDMRSGKKKYLFATYSLAKEGLDIPRLERLFMATPQKDYAVITQSIGRIARIYKDKKDAVCYDFIDDIRFLYKAYKKRCTTYRKNGCYFVEGG